MANTWTTITNTGPTAWRNMPTNNTPEPRHRRAPLQARQIPPPHEHEDAVYMENGPGVTISVGDPITEPVMPRERYANHTIPVGDIRDYQDNIAQHMVAAEDRIVDAPEPPPPFTDEEIIGWRRRASMTMSQAQDAGIDYENWRAEVSHAQRWLNRRGLPYNERGPDIVERGIAAVTNFHNEYPGPQHGVDAAETPEAQIQTDLPLINVPEKRDSWEEMFGV